jgi:hypothetical protein
MKLSREIVLSDTRGYCNVKRAAQYAGVSERTLSRVGVTEGIRGLLNTVSFISSDFNPRGDL